MSDGLTVARVLGTGLAAVGIGAVYGCPFGELPVLAAPTPLAPVLAAAHRRVLGPGAAVHLGHGRFVVGSPPDGTAAEEVADPAALAEVLARLAAADPWASFAFHLDLDPGAPTASPPAPPTAPPRWVDPDGALAGALAASDRPVVLAGPGVVAHGLVPGLHALAAAGSLGVLNTWGAKGVFDWRSRHHLATVGLQRDDLRLGGLDQADLVLTTGLDPAETPPEVVDHPGRRDVAPGALGPLAERVARPPAPIAVPAIRAGLAAVTAEGWGRRNAPLAPSQATRTYGAVTAGRGLVAAQPGTAGYWVARTFPTTVVGEAVVPGRGTAPGFAVAAALVAGRHQPGRAVVAVADGPLDETSLLLLEEAARLGVPVVVEVWDPDGPGLDEAGHRDRLVGAVASGRPHVLTLATDAGQLARMVEVAGPVVAWDGGGGVGT